MSAKISVICKEMREIELDNVNLRPEKRPNSELQTSLETSKSKKQIKIEDNISSPSITNNSVHLNHSKNCSKFKSSTGNNNINASNTGHRPVTSCTHCRQHKIKCNASENFPAPCSRCDRMGLHCEINPQFRPKKGSQLQKLRHDVDELKVKIEYLIRNEKILTDILQQSSSGQLLLKAIKEGNFYQNQVNSHKGSIQTYLSGNPHLSRDKQTNIGNNNQHRMDGHQTEPNSSVSNHVPNMNDEVSKTISSESLSGPTSTKINKELIPSILSTNTPKIEHEISAFNSTSDVLVNMKSLHKEDKEKNQINVLGNTLPSSNVDITEFILGDVHLCSKRADELHQLFMTRYLPYFPIMCSNSATELYTQSQFLFWTVMLTACLSDPEPILYNKLAALIKQLAIETCWIRTPRSTHISQALLILCNWTLPNQKVLDDCSYRFVGLAKSLSFQLGLHRGKFMTEFTRTQTSMPDAEKWRSRAWLGIFFAEQCWASILGLPPTFQTDYLIEKAIVGDDDELPKRFRQFICLASFQAKLCNSMGSSVNSPDGLINAKDRASSLEVLEDDLFKLDEKLKFDEDIVVEIYYLYVKLMICCFAFLPETPIDDQIKYATKAYLSATRIVTLLTKILETRQLIELPIYIRQSATYAAMILFKLQLTSLLTDNYLDSARQSVVTIHRLYRNQLTAWATSVENDISRTACVLEKLNFVLITHPEVFIEKEGIISRMRSHLTGTLFYDLVWCIHEARRRQLDPEYYQEILKKSKKNTEQAFTENSTVPKRKLFPLPFYNQISKEDFETITQTTPGGTTVTTLVPTKNAIKQARQLARIQGDSNGHIKYINGIPISMLDATGSVNTESTKGEEIISDNTSTNPSFLVAAQLQKGNEISTNSNLSINKSISVDTNNSLTVPSATVSQHSMNDSLYTRYHDSKTNSSGVLSNNTKSLFTMNNSLQPNALLNHSLSNNSRTSTSSLTTLSSPTSSIEVYPNFNIFLNTNGNIGDSSRPNNEQRVINNLPSSMHSHQLSELDNFFLQQSAGWIEGNSNHDDFLGWFDMNMAPEF